MSRVECPICHRAANLTASTILDDRFHNQRHDFTFLGVVLCFPSELSISMGEAAQRLLNDGASHSFPIKFTVSPADKGPEIGIMPPPHVVDALNTIVKEAESQTVMEVLTKAERPDLIQDIEEAKSAKLWELYKASAVMCRRVIQIALADCLGKTAGIQVAIEVVNKKWVPADLPGLTLGLLLGIERVLEAPLLNPFQRGIANEIKEVGDDGAHNKTEFDPGFIDTCIRESAIIAAVLVQKSNTPASQSERENNEL